MNRRCLAVAVAAASVTLTSCTALQGPGHYTLPGTVATGGDGYRVTAEFRDIDNLVPNSEVLYNDLVIGSVRSLEVRNWHAVAHLSLKKSVPLPRNITAIIGQKSLLGAEYVEIDRPKDPAGRLREGDTITLDNTGSYPATEQVLSAVSLLLNNGGLSQIQTITSQLNAALSGREQDARSLITQLQTFTGSLNGQRSSITEALTQVNNLASVLAKRQGTISAALKQIPAGLATLDRERAELTAAVKKIGQFGEVATSVIDETRPELVNTLRSLRPVLAALQKTGESLPRSLEELTFPLPLQHVPRIVQGDFMNFYITLDLSVPSLVNDLVGPDDLRDLRKLAQLPSQPTDPLTKALARQRNSPPGGAARPTPPGQGSVSPTPSPSTCGDPLSRLLGLSRGGC